MSEKKRKVTLCIPVRGEEPMLEGTIRQARESAGQPIDVILIKDGVGPDWSLMDVDQLIGNQRPRGSSWSRDRGVMAAATDIVANADGHMLFSDQWAVALCDFYARKANKEKVCCAKMGECNPDHQRMPTPPQHGARIAYQTVEWGGGDVNYKEFRSLHAKWDATQKPGPISCVMGAFYACRKKAYEETLGKPWSVGTAYGCDEELISIAGHMLGGGVELLDTITAYHCFQRDQRWSKNLTSVDNIGIWLNRFRLLALLPMEQEERDTLYEWQMSNAHIFVSTEMYATAIAADWQRPEVRALGQRIAAGHMSWAEFKAAHVKVYADPDIAAQDIKRRAACEERYGHTPAPLTTPGTMEPADQYADIVAPRRCVRQQFVRRVEVCEICDGRDTFKVQRSVRGSGNTPSRQYLRCTKCGQPAIRINEGAISQDRAAAMIN